MTMYPHICRIAHEIIEAGFSDAVIQPGVTTTDDVVWWYRERIKELKLDTWFHPSVSVDRAEPNATLLKRPQPLVIMPGDLLHVDFGITYLRLNTDTQQHAYVLMPGGRRCAFVSQGGNGQRQSASGYPHEEFSDWQNRESNTCRHKKSGDSSRTHALDLHAPHWLSRARCRNDDRTMGHAERCSQYRRLSYAQPHRIFNRT